MVGLSSSTKHVRSAKAAVVAVVDAAGTVVVVAADAVATAAEADAEVTAADATAATTAATGNHPHKIAPQATASLGHPPRRMPGESGWPCASDLSPFGRITIDRARRCSLAPLSNRKPFLG